MGWDAAGLRGCFRRMGVRRASFDWRRRGRRDGLAAPAAGRGHDGRPGPRQHPLHVQAAVRLDDDACVELARRYQIDIEPIGITAGSSARTVQPFPIDEIVMQRIVDGVQAADGDVAGQLQHGLGCSRSEPWRRLRVGRLAESSKCAVRYTAELL